MPNLDPLDRLDWPHHFENPAQYEKVMREEIFVAARTDADLAEILRLHCLDEDRAAAFSRFAHSHIPGELIRLLEMFGVGRSNTVADFGCGPGQASYALAKAGFRRVLAIDPNAEYFTGTGYLASLEIPEIEIVSSADDPSLYRAADAALTIATIHHWQHIPQTALALRRCLKPGGVWLSTKEQFTVSPRNLVESLEAHPFWNRFRTYEWYYPPSVYVDLIENVGFSLKAVVPWMYRRNRLVLLDETVLPPGMDDHAMDAEVGLHFGSGQSVENFWAAVNANRRGLEANAYYLYPQAFVFQRIEP